MKTILLIRHAKSDWGDSSVSDFDRKLNERGKRDAPEMAKRLAKRKIKIDAFVSSPARRARKTCNIFAEEFGFDKDQVILLDKLYQASSDNFYEVIRDMDDDFKRIAIFAHNPGITDFANSLCIDRKIDNMPTSSIFAVEADVKKWSEFELAPRTFLFFDFPKSLVL